MDVLFQQKETHLVAICGGDWSGQAIPAMLRRIREEAERRHCDRVLMDGFAVPSPPNMSEQLVAADQISKILGPPLKVAFIYSDELTTKMTDVVSEQDEAFRMFDSEYEALDWLLLA